MSGNSIKIIFRADDENNSSPTQGPTDLFFGSRFKIYSRFILHTAKAQWNFGRIFALFGMEFFGFRFAENFLLQSENWILVSFQI